MKSLLLILFGLNLLYSDVLEDKCRLEITIEINKVFDHKLIFDECNLKDCEWNVKKDSILPYWLKLQENFTVITIAGNGNPGLRDADMVDASFHYPEGIAVDNQNNIYVVDYYNNKIRKITSSGKVLTFAGSGSLGSADGNGSIATFAHPIGITIDNANNIYIADNLNNKIRKITQKGIVTTVAGTGRMGSTDGKNSVASFNRPSALIVNNNGDLYITDTNNHIVRKITRNGIVSTFAGSGKIGSEDGNSSVASFYSPQGIVIDSIGDLYITDTYNHKIRKITRDGVVSTFAGDGKAGFKDGQGYTASFNYPQAIGIDSNDNLYIADLKNHKIRKITRDGYVTTLAGNGEKGSSDGNAKEASFAYPKGITINNLGIIYVSNTYNHNIRMIKKIIQLVGTPKKKDIGLSEVYLIRNYKGVRLECSIRIIVTKSKQKYSGDF